MRNRGLIAQFAIKLFLKEKYKNLSFAEKINETKELEFEGDKNGLYERGFILKQSVRSTQLYIN